MRSDLTDEEFDMLNTKADALTAEQYNSLINDEWAKHADYAAMTNENIPLRAFLVTVFKKAAISVSRFSYINEMIERLGEDFVDNVEAMRRMTEKSIEAFDFPKAVEGELLRFIQSRTAGNSRCLYPTTNIVP